MLLTISLADPRGARDARPRIQILSFSCSFLPKNRKLDSITAKRHRLQKIFDNFKLKKLDDELNANSEHLEVDQDLDESVSSPVEENDKKVMKYVIEEVPPEKKFKHMITVNIPSGGRLGNLMFSYASMYGIAMENFMIPSLDYDSVLFKYFNITAKSIGANENKEAGQCTQRELPTFTLSMKLIGSIMKLTFNYMVSSNHGNTLET